MPVDRAARDRLAEDIAQYMRGEIQAFAFDERLGAYEPSPDNDIKTLRHLLWYHYDDLIDHPVSLSEEGWDLFKRILAFLQTDLSLGEKQVDKRARRFCLLVGGFFLGIQATAVAVSMWQGGWGIAQTTWILLGCLWAALSFRALPYLGLAALFLALAGPGFQAPWMVYACWSMLTLVGVGLLIDYVRSFRSSPEVEPPDYSPFRDEAQWKRYEPLVEPFNLPPYTPCQQGLPYRSRVTSFLMTLVSAPTLPLIWPILMLMFLKTVSMPEFIIEEETQKS